MIINLLKIRAKAKKSRMLSHVMLPWWGWGYLLFVLLMFVASFFTDKSPKFNEISSSVLSLFSICVFVISFFNYQLIEFLGVLIIPMTLIGIYWEFTRAIIETKHAEVELANEVELDDSERKFLLNMAIGFNAVIVVPGYIIGMVLSIDVLRGGV